MRQPVTLVFDIGKTNKKLFIFDEHLREISHEYAQFDEVSDEDGFMSEDLPSLVRWIKASVQSLVAKPSYDLQAINFSTYGASMVHLDRAGVPVIPFLNYLKPFPGELLQDFFAKYGPAESFSLETASPSMGMLNSGLQLYYLKYNKPDAFRLLHQSLHFPQYLSYLFTGRASTDYTSIGCHTGLWDYKRNCYAHWLKKENLLQFLAQPEATGTVYPATVHGKTIRIGIGVHDSSSALLPYLSASEDPFVLISTGTWSICMNPFNSSPLSVNELQADCLHFLDINGRSVKASRLFLGNQLDRQVKQMADFFNVGQEVYKAIPWEVTSFKSKRKSPTDLLFDHSLLAPERFGFTNNPRQDLSTFESFEQAYYQLMDELTDLQIASLKLAIGTSGIKTVYVDGGFSSNDIFVGMLASKLTGYKIYSTSFALGTALGAALLVNYRGMSGEVLKNNYNIKRHLPLEINEQ